MPCGNKYEKGKETKKENMKEKKKNMENKRKREGKKTIPVYMQKRDHI